MVNFSIFALWIALGDLDLPNPLGIDVPVRGTAVRIGRLGTLEEKAKIA